MVNSAELNKLFNQIVDKYSDSKPAIVCTVVEVDKTARTCTVLPLNGDPEIFDVMLQAGQDGSTGITMIPKVDSSVIVSFITDETAFISLTSRVESFSIKSETEDLKSILSDILSAIEQLTVNTAVGPSTPPLNLSVFTSIKQRLNSLFE